MEKRETKKGAIVISITNSCGSAGCAYKQYTMPYMGTKEDFQRHLKEKFKTFKAA